jgi:RHS repeat-associated protein
VTWHRVAGVYGDTVSQPVGTTAANPQRFPGQQQDAVTGLYYNYYRDYDPATGRYLEADPSGLNGGTNLYTYAAGNPVRFGDPSGLETAVIIGGPTNGNPFGHAAVATTGNGVISFGTRTAPRTNLTDYLADQSQRRSSTVYILNTTPEQERRIRDKMMSYYRKNGGRLPDPFSDLSGAWEDTCATRVRDSLIAAGIPISFIARHSPLPGDLGLAVSGMATSIFSVQQQ